MYERSTQFLNQLVVVPAQCISITSITAKEDKLELNAGMHNEAETMRELNTRSYGCEL